MALCLEDPPGQMPMMEATHSLVAISKIPIAKMCCWCLLSTHVTTVSRQQARIDVAGLQILPLAGAFQGGRSPMALTERQSRKPPVPDLRLDVMTDAILPLVRNLFDFSFPV